MSNDEELQNLSNKNISNIKPCSETFSLDCHENKIMKTQTKEENIPNECLTVQVESLPVLIGQQCKML